MKIKMTTKLKVRSAHIAGLMSGDTSTQIHPIATSPSSDSSFDKQKAARLTERQKATPKRTTPHSIPLKREELTLSMDPMSW